MDIALQDNYSRIINHANALRSNIIRVLQENGGSVDVHPFDKTPDMCILVDAKEPMTMVRAFISRIYTLNAGTLYVEATGVEDCETYIKGDLSTDELVTIAKYLDNYATTRYVDNDVSRAIASMIDTDSKGTIAYQFAGDLLCFNKCDESNPEHADAEAKSTLLSAQETLLTNKEVAVDMQFNEIADFANEYDKFLIIDECLCILVTDVIDTIIKENQ